jgi:hypothetical protein
MIVEKRKIYVAKTMLDGEEIELFSNSDMTEAFAMAEYWKREFPDLWLEDRPSC